MEDNLTETSSSADVQTDDSGASGSQTETALPAPDTTSGYADLGKSILDNLNAGDSAATETAANTEVASEEIDPNASTEEGSEVADDSATADKIEAADDQSTAKIDSDQEPAAQLETLQRERDEAIAKLETFGQQFEDIGGAEGFAHVQNAYNALVDPSRHAEAVEFINQSPARHQISRTLVAGALGIRFDGDATAADQSLEQSTQAIENRQFLLNNVLRHEFGLNADLSADELSRTFEWIAAKKSADAANFLVDLEYDLESIGFDRAGAVEQTKISQLQSQISELEARLQNPAPETESELAGDDLNQNEKLAKFTGEFAARFDAHETETFTKFAEPLYAEFGLAVNSKDSAEIAGAKQLLQTALKLHVTSAARATDTNKAVATRLWANEKADPVLAHRYGNTLKSTLRQSLAAVQPFLAALSGGSSASPATRTATAAAASTINRHGQQSTAAQSARGSIAAPPAPAAQLSSWSDLAGDVMRRA